MGGEALILSFFSYSHDTRQTYHTPTPCEPPPTHCDTVRGRPGEAVVGSPRSVGRRRRANVQERSTDTVRSSIRTSTECSYAHMYIHMYVHYFNPRLDRVIWPRHRACNATSPSNTLRTQDEPDLAQNDKLYPRALPYRMHSSYEGRGCHSSMLSSGHYSIPTTATLGLHQCGGHTRGCCDEYDA